MGFLKNIFNKGIFVTLKIGKYGLTQEEIEQKKEQARKEPVVRNEITLCPNCYCMTKTVKGRCGKCKEEK